MRQQDHRDRNLNGKSLEALTDTLDNWPILLTKEVSSVVAFPRRVLRTSKIEIYASSSTPYELSLQPCFRQRRRTYRIRPVDDRPRPAHDHVRVVPA